MPRFGKAYMRPKKLARRGEGLSTSGGSELTSVRVPEAIRMTKEAPAVGTEAQEGREVRGALEMATEGPLLVEGATLGMTSVVDTSGSGSSGSESFIPSVEDSKELGSKEVVPEAWPATAAPPAAGRVEDDSWYMSIQDFVRREAEGEAGTPPHFTQAHIPRDKMQASGPRRDAARAELAVATLAAKGQVITLSIQIQFIIIFDLI